MTEARNKLIVYYDGACPSCVEDRERYEKMAGEGARDVEWLDITGLPVIRPVVSWTYRAMVDRRLRRTGRD